MKQYTPLIFLIFSIVWITTGCSKDEGEFSDVTIVSINQNGSFEFGDTIVVIADITNKDGAVQAVILDGSRQLGFSFELFNTAGNRHTFLIYLDDKYLESGNYDVRISAFNEDNKTSSFQKVVIKELPKYLRGVCFVTDGSNGSTLYKRDSTGIVTTVPLASGYNFNRVAVNNRNGQLIAAPKGAGPVEAFGFNKLDADYSSFILPINSTFFDNLYTVDDENYVFLRDGRIMSFLENGGNFQKLILPDNYLPKVADFDEERTLIGARQQGTGLNEIFLIRRSNNFVLQRTATQGRVVDISNFDANHYYFTYQKNGDAIIADFDRQSNLITERYTISGESPQAILIAGGNGYLATENKIYSFGVSNFQFPAELFNFGASDLVFDDVNQELYMISGTNLWKSPLGSVQNQFVASTSDSIQAMTLVYNK